jgi:hypothetical protein
MIPSEFIKYVEDTSRVYILNAIVDPSDRIDFASWLIPRLVLVERQHNLFRNSAIRMVETTYRLSNADSSVKFKFDLKWFTRDWEFNDNELLQHIYNLCLEYKINFDILFSTVKILPYIPLTVDQINSTLNWWYDIIHINPTNNTKFLENQFENVFTYAYMSPNTLPILEWLWDCSQIRAIPFVYEIGLIHGLCSTGKIVELNWIISKHRILGTEFIISSNIIAFCCYNGCMQVLQLLWDLRNEFKFNYDYSAFDNACLINPSSLIMVKWWFDRLILDGLELKSSPSALENAFNTHNLEVINYLFDQKNMFKFEFESVCVDVLPCLPIPRESKIASLTWLWDHRHDVKIEYSSKFFNNCLNDSVVARWYMDHVNLGLEWKYDREYIMELIKVFNFEGYDIRHVRFLIEYADSFPTDLRELLMSAKQAFIDNRIDLVDE